MQGRMFSINMVIATITAPVGLAVIAPYGTRLLSHVVTAGGPAGGLAGVVVGTGPGRAIGLFYVLCAIALAFLVLTAWKRQTIARFDLDVPDALPDDLLGLEAVMARTEQSAAAADPSVRRGR
jgi:hypothetical protein